MAKYFYFEIIKYFGMAAMSPAFLAVTPYHDTAITFAGTLGLVSMFYITVFVLKSKLHWLKILSVICLLGLYTCNYIYYTNSYIALLPVLQKLSLAVAVTWILSLQYFTTVTDFDPKVARQ